MASQGVNEFLCSAWREQWTAEQWAFKVNEYIGNLDSETARRVLLQLIGKHCGQFVQWWRQRKVLWRATVAKVPTVSKAKKF